MGLLLFLCFLVGCTPLELNLVEILGKGLLEGLSFVEREAINGLKESEKKELQEKINKVTCCDEHRLETVQKHLKKIKK